MADVMDHLTLEHKDVPVYTENLYKWTPKPSVLKRDIDWDAPIIENLECPYCREENPQDLFYDGSIFIYIDPCGYLRFGDSNGIGKIDIIFCPICGKQLK